MTRGRVHHGAVTGAILTAALCMTVALNATSWVGTTFPGFFLMPNRVVPSITLPGWLDVPQAAILQHQIVAVNGLPVSSPADAYRAVERQLPGDPIRYSLRAPDGTPSVVTNRARRFAWRDFLLIFGAYFLNGLAFLAVGLVVFHLAPGQGASLALLIAGSATGLWCITGADLYGPGWFWPLHVIAESTLGLALVHLAVVFPTNRLGPTGHFTLCALYAVAAILGLSYLLGFDEPSLYTRLHLVATATHGLGTAAIMASVGWGFLRSRSALVRRRTSVVALGSLLGFGVPVVASWGSALLGGSIPVNVAACSAFLFPLSLGYAVLKRDLFQIDLFLRRAVTYPSVALAIAGLYLAGLYTAHLLVPGRVFSPAVLALLNFALLFLLEPLRERVQRAVDRVCFRQTYHPDQTLAVLSERLASARTFLDVEAETRGILETALAPATITLLRPNAEGQLEATSGTPVALEPDLTERVSRGDVVGRYEWEDSQAASLPLALAALNAEVLVPVPTSHPSVPGLLALGPKESGQAYTPNDIAFLRTVAGQITLALTSAEAFEDLQLAYQQLEQNQTSLVQADRLATLGRLTAGIAHEVNTPIAAVRNALRLLTDLGNEYSSSIADDDVGPDDHREIAQEIVATAENADRWAQKAAAFIGRIKMQGRDAGGSAERFIVEHVVTEARSLLAHRLRAGKCSLDYVEDPVHLSMVGDPTRLGQIIVNLAANAIDAYEDAGMRGGRVEVFARVERDHVVLSVSDRAGGIPPDVLPRLFDELFTTKEPGRGTGLGLWIARNLAEDTFGGTLTVETEQGLGTCFTLRAPLRADARSAAA